MPCARRLSFLAVLAAGLAVALPTAADGRPIRQQMESTTRSCRSFTVTSIYPAVAFPGMRAVREQARSYALMSCGDVDNFLNKIANDLNDEIEQGHALGHDLGTSRWTTRDSDYVSNLKVGWLVRLRYIKGYTRFFDMRGVVVGTAITTSDPTVRLTFEMGA